MEDFADFDFFFKEYYVSLYSYAHSLINNWEVSRDIASDAFEYIWKNFDRIEKATAKSYLFIYVRNRAIDYLRHQDIHYAYAEFSQKLYENYTERLEKIVSQIDNNELEIDELAVKIKEANEIIAFCSDKLTKADREVQKLLSDKQES